MVGGARVSNKADWFAKGIVIARLAGQIAFLVLLAVNIFLQLSNITLPPSLPPSLQLLTIGSFMVSTAAVLEEIRHDRKERLKILEEIKWDGKQRLQEYNTRQFESYDDILNYAADAMSRYQLICDTSWNPPRRIGGTKEVFDRYIQAKKNAATRNTGLYREIWTFPLPDRVNRCRTVSPILQQEGTCYEAKFFDIENQGESTVPPIPIFLLLGNYDAAGGHRYEELLLLTYRQRPDERRLSIRNRPTIDMFVAYFEGCWEKSKELTLEVVKKLEESVGNKNEFNQGK